MDNTATGTTLKANQLVIIDELFKSSTHVCVHKSVLQDRKKRLALDELVLLLKSALNARDRVLIEFNGKSKKPLSEPKLTSVFSCQSRTVGTHHCQTPRIETTHSIDAVWRRYIFYYTLMSLEVDDTNPPTGFAVRSAIPRKDLVSIIPLIKGNGGTDVIVSNVKQIIL